jgi:hypothetical protein
VRKEGRQDTHPCCVIEAGTKFRSDLTKTLQYSNGNAHSHTSCCMSYQLFQVILPRPFSTIQRAGHEGFRGHTALTQGALVVHGGCQEANPDVVLAVEMCE